MATPDAYKAFICATDFECELSDIPVKIYPPETEDKICVRSCGIYELLITPQKRIPGCDISWYIAEYDHDLRDIDPFYVPCNNRFHLTRHLPKAPLHKGDWLVVTVEMTRVVRNGKHSSYISDEAEGPLSDSESDDYFFGQYKDDIERSKLCACYHCMKTFPASEVVRYALGKNDEETYAICPFCEIDAVVGNIIGDHVLTEEWKRQKHTESFGS